MEPASESERIHELIQLHLDEAASEAERAELNRLLEGDPEVADAFVRAVRFGANLEAGCLDRQAGAGGAVGKLGGGLWGGGGGAGGPPGGTGGSTGATDTTAGTPSPTSDFAGLV